MACSISIQSLCSNRNSSSAPILVLENTIKNGYIVKFPSGKRKISRKCKAMVQETAQRGPSAAYAKEMERLSAKESLLLALKVSGGFESLVTGKTTNVQRIDVNERIVSLERLNPTPRPTTSPFLEGRWNFEWFGPGSPGLYAAQFLFERFHPSFANLSKLNVLVGDGYADISASVKLLNTLQIESSFTVSTRLSVEGPLRMKEEYIEGIFESPKVNEKSIPEQLRGAFGQTASSMQQFFVPITDALAGGLKVPLGEHFKLFTNVYMCSFSKKSSWRPPL
ncbi:probable plastid-lipid-associated protein 13 chloroplastic [Phtheirospermum japonicum]|uniref:Probable plastid-lipid-associated protein 13 chloroplastic n=1 Tax=Phtheirospermum japonicum TaxID=374723 RepID=A0A830C6B2_9LAMI|nr:probable plastid-lipid-associated protein 13 chloroplastic [Phtheirospermum japonicum]